MQIKSSQVLINEALEEVKTISPLEALKLYQENKCDLIDIRDDLELQNQGTIENSCFFFDEFHIYLNTFVT